MGGTEKGQGTYATMLVPNSQAHRVKSVLGSHVLDTLVCISVEQSS